MAADVVGGAGFADSAVGGAALAVAGLALGAAVYLVAAGAGFEDAAFGGAALGGAALGGLMGGGRGAALGGFGGLSLPILMALSQGKDPTFGLSNLFNGNQQDAEGAAPAAQAVQPQQPGAPSPSAPVAPAPIDEVGRKELQQAFANQEGQPQGQGQ